MTIYNAVSALNYGVYNNIVSIYLPYTGTYDCDISFPIWCVPGDTADCSLRYCISTNSTTPDSIASNTLAYYTISAGLQNTLITLTCRRIMYVSSPTNICLIVWFSGGTNTYATIQPTSFIRYTRIA